MINPRDLVEAVEFKPHFDQSTIGFNESLGFLEVAAENVAVGGLRLLGFSTPLAREGGFNRDNFVTPLTELNELPLEARNIDMQGKGVGPRLYNVREAFGGARQKPPFIGVYTVDIQMDRLLDGRLTQGGKMARISRHAGRILRSKLRSLENVVADIHDSYGDADAVELEMPPLPELRQATHKVKNPEGATPSFIIVRNPALVLTKVGETDAPW